MVCIYPPEVREVPDAQEGLAYMYLDFNRMPTTPWYATTKDCELLRNTWSRRGGVCRVHASR